MAIIDDFNRIPLITYGMFIKDKTKNIKATSLTLKIGIMTKLTMNIFVQTISDWVLKDMPIVMINMDLRDFKLYECDDCSECLLKHQCMKFNSKRIKIMKNYNWEYFKAQINKSFQNQNKTIYSQRKIDVEPVLDL